MSLRERSGWGAGQRGQRGWVSLGPWQVELFTEQKALRPRPGLSQGTRDGRCGTRSITPRTCLDVGDTGGVSTGSLLAPQLGVARGRLLGRAASGAPLSSRRCSEERCPFQPVSFSRSMLWNTTEQLCGPLLLRRLLRFLMVEKDQSKHIS